MAFFLLGRAKNLSASRRIGDWVAPKSASKVWKIPPPASYDQRTVQSLASRYTDFAPPSMLCMLTPGSRILLEKLTGS